MTLNERAISVEASWVPEHPSGSSGQPCKSSLIINYYDEYYNHRLKRNIPSDKIPRPISQPICNRAKISPQVLLGSGLLIHSPTSVLGPSIKKEALSSLMLWSSALQSLPQAPLPDTLTSLV